MEYLQQTEKPGGCIFCIKISEGRDRENLILHRGSYSCILMNLYPYNTGHLMVIPYKHVSTTEELDANTLAEMTDFVHLSMRILRRSMGPHGFNIGINIGRAAGAGIAEHVHIHIVPRWEGDTNFLTIFAQTRVIPERIEDTYDKLLQAVQVELEGK